MRHFIVLSGGSIRGAWQTGALIGALEKLDQGGEIAGIYGISVGALHTAFLASNVSYAGSTATVADLLVAAKELRDFWINEITGPSSLVTPHDMNTLARSILGQGAGGSIGVGWRGIVDHTPLLDRFRKISDQKRIAQAPFEACVGYTDYVSGAYADRDLRTIKNDQGIENAVFASAVTPLIMDMIRFKLASGDHVMLSDGGLRHVVPVDEVEQRVDAAIKSGTAPADVHVHVFVCGPAQLPEWKVDDHDLSKEAWRPGLIDVIDRAFSMMTQTVIDSDVYKLRTEITARGGCIDVYRHPTEYLTNSITSFTKKDVAAMLKAGYDLAKSL